MVPMFSKPTALEHLKHDGIFGHVIDWNHCLIEGSDSCLLRGAAIDHKREGVVCTYTLKNKYSGPFF